jgi:hypothetical protein
MSAGLIYVLLMGSSKRDRLMPFAPAPSHTLDALQERSPDDRRTCLSAQSLRQERPG